MQSKECSNASLSVLPNSYSSGEGDPERRWTSSVRIQCAVEDCPLRDKLVMGSGTKREEAVRQRNSKLKKIILKDCQQRQKPIVQVKQ